AGRDLREHGAAVGVEAVVLVHHGEGLHVLQGFADILTGERTEGADLDLAHLLALGPQLVDGLLGGAGGGADDDDGLLSVVHHIGLDQAVGPAGHLAEFLAHLADHVLGVHHGLGLLPLGLHVVHGRGVGAHGHGLAGLQQRVGGLVLTHELLDLLCLHQLDVLDGVGGDEAVLAHHDGQAHRLRDPHGLQVVVVGLLVRLRKQHQPAGIPHAHGVGVVVVD
ncbi:HNH endonuclease, partial [Dysosmobacter welbionis]